MYYSTMIQKQQQSVFILLSCLLLAYFVWPFFTSPVYAAECIDDWENSLTIEGTPGNGGFPGRYLDSRPITEVNYSWVMPSDRAPGYPSSVSFGVKTQINSAMYSSIFGNYMNVLSSFVNIPDAQIQAILETTDPAKLAAFNNFRCVHGANDKTQGTVQLTAGSTFTYMALIEEERSETCTLDPAAGGGPDCPGDGDTIDCDTYDPATATSVTCRIKYEVEKPKQYSDAPDQNNSGTTDWPFVSRSLREIGIKIASTMKEQWCNTDDEPNACLEGSYCKEITELPEDEAWRNAMSVDPSSNGKNGVCQRKEEDVVLSDQEWQVKQLCSETAPFTPGTISSKICIYNNGFHFSDPSNIREVTTTNPDGSTDTGDVFDPACSSSDPVQAANCKSNLPMVNDGQIKSGDNLLPFDVGLFQDRGESTNTACKSTDPEELKNCRLDGYYRRLLTRASQYTPEEYTLIESIPAKTGLGLKTEPFELDGVDALPGEISGKWIFDFIDNLGGYYELSNDLRFMGKDLIPSGFKVMKEGEHRAYLRAINSLQRGLLFVDSRMMASMPILNGAEGEKITDPQGAPFLVSQRSGQRFTVAFSAFQDKYIASSGYLYVDNGMQTPFLLKVPGTNGSYIHETLRAFMNSEGDVVLFASPKEPGGAFPARGTYYSIYRNGAFSNWTAMASDMSLIADFALDPTDVIHAVGSQGRQDGESQTYWGMDHVNYHRYQFKQGTLVETGSQKITLNVEGNSYKTRLTKPFSIQADLYSCQPACGADLVVSAEARGSSSEHQFETDMLYFEITPQGFVGVQEVAVRRADNYTKYAPTINTEFKNVINSLQGVGANIVTVNDSKYIVYQTNYYTQNEDAGIQTSVRQINFAKKTISRGWKQDFNASSPVYYTIGRTVLDPNDRARYGISLGNVSDAIIGINGDLSFSLMETLTKYDTNSHVYDAAGFKACMFNFGKWQYGNQYCGLITDQTRYVVPPTQNNDPATGQSAIGFDKAPIPPQY
jgi:hypothetical protein